MSAKGKSDAGEPGQAKKNKAPAKNRLVALRATLSVRYHGLKERTRETLGRSLFDFLLGSASELHAEVLAHPDVQRVEIAQGTQQSISMVFRQGKPETFWDSGLRAWADLKGIESPIGPIAPSRNLKLNSPARKGEIRAEITGHDDHLGVFRHEFEFNQSTELQPFAEAIFKVLFCCKASHVNSRLPYDDLIGMGCLKVARTYLGDSKGTVFRGLNRVWESGRSGLWGIRTAGSLRIPQGPNERCRRGPDEGCAQYQGIEDISDFNSTNT
jgi:hypothetical protein